MWSVGLTFTPSYVKVDHEIVDTFHATLAEKESHHRSALDIKFHAALNLAFLELPNRQSTQH